MLHKNEIKICLKKARASLEQRKCIDVHRGSSLQWNIKATVGKYSSSEPGSCDLNLNYEICHTNLTL